MVGLWDWLSPTPADPYAAPVFPQQSSDAGSKAAPILPPAPYFSTPPDWAQSLVKGAVAPITDAGAYLGGMMGGQIPFHPAEAMQQAVMLGSSMLGPKLGAGTMAAMAAPMAKAGARLAPEAEQAAAQGIRAYHGSPHDFNQFDLSKVGTGEGAQAYGHGLYFAENEDVAKGYRDALSGNWPKLSKTIGESAALPPEIKGHMYEVNINANPDHFLDWDKPLSKQPAQVQDALKKVPWANEYLNTETYTGRDIAAANPAGVQQMRQAGIPGIKYLDQGSRGSGDGTRNYVVFDPSIIEIMKKYGIAGLASYLGAKNLAIPQQQAPVF